MDETVKTNSVVAANQHLRMCVCVCVCARAHAHMGWGAYRMQHMLDSDVLKAKISATCQ